MRRAYRLPCPNVLLAQKYHVVTAFYILGYMPSNHSLYRRLERFGYELQFKPVVQGKRHDPKGNVDADLVLKKMIGLPNFDQAVIASGDGDYYSLVDFLQSQQKRHRAKSEILLEPDAQIGRGITPLRSGRSEPG